MCMISLMIILAPTIRVIMMTNIISNPFASAHEPYIRVDKHGNILFAMRIQDELVTSDMIPITLLEYKFICRYGLDLEPVKHARFARSIKKKINSYLGGDMK